MDYFKTDAIELQKAMVEKNIRTVTELSRISGVSRNTTAKVVDGEIRPSTEVMYKFAHALELDSIKAGRIFFAPNLLTK